MYGDNNNDTNNQQQPGDNTPPPMLDTPMSTDGSNMPGAPSASNDDDTPFTTDTDAGNYMTGDAPNDQTLSGANSDEDAKNQMDMDSQPSSPDPSPPGDSSANDLLDLKQQALQQLAPLVNHLDQPPEDEFRTTMMMIQASDNKELLPKAYEAAQKITDDKLKAQALLDVINEINYFTQHHEQ